MTRIREGLADRVATLPSFIGRSYATFPDKLIVPAAIVNIPKWDYHQPHSRIDAEVLLLAAETGKGQQRAQAKLDAWLDEDDVESVKAAIEADPTLGGVVSDVIVRGFSEYGEVEVNSIPHLGAVLNVEVVT